MNNIEFNREFDLLYDNASKGARGLNEYEKSVFLTIAQEDIVKEIYSPYSKDKTSFEASEDNRRGINFLERAYVSKSPVPYELGISSDSKIFEIPTGCWYIFYEKLKLKNRVYGKSEVGIKPVTHDEYNISSENPFRKPNELRAWRLESGNIAGMKTVEIVYPNEIDAYYMRYIVQPEPIVLINFENNDELSGMNLSINGKNTLTECKLSSELHRDILRRAIELSILASRENSLSSQVQLNTRNV